MLTGNLILNCDAAPITNICSDWIGVLYLICETSQWNTAMKQSKGLNGGLKPEHKRTANRVTMSPIAGKDTQVPTIFLLQFFFVFMSLSASVLLCPIIVYSLSFLYSIPCRKAVCRDCGLSWVTCIYINNTQLFYLQSTLVISNSLISNYPLSQSKNLVPV